MNALILQQVCVGKEREAVLEMLPYLRLGYVSDPSEMETVLSSQGPICPVKSSGCCKLLDHGYIKLKLHGLKKKGDSCRLLSSLVENIGTHAFIMACDIFSSNPGNLISI